MKFEVIIPTYKRESDLKECLNSIYCQKLLPQRIIIIDDDNSKIIAEEEKRFAEKGVDFYHYIKNHKQEGRGSNESRNKGLELAQEEIIFIFDDDIILCDNYFEQIMKLWQLNKDNEELIGISGIAQNFRRKTILEKIYNSIFGLCSDLKWDVNEVGFQVWDTGIKKIEKGYYMLGFCCSYRREITNDIKFTIFKGGRGGNVDPDFSLRAKNRGYHFLINPQAKVIHKESKTSREKAFLTGYKDAANRKIIFRNNCKKSFKNYVWFYWANIGWTLREFLVGRFKTGLGMIKGLIKKQ